MMNVLRILRRNRAGCVAAVGCVISLLLNSHWSGASAQSASEVAPAKIGQPTAPPNADGASVLLPPPRADLAAPVETFVSSRVFSPEDEARLMPINLATALRMAGTDNLDITQAREGVNRAQLQLLQAYAMILPTLNLGSTYTRHEGKIAKTEGNVITVNKDSLFVGLGPSLTMNFAEALFTPLVARQLSVAGQAGGRRVQNDTLGVVAEAYFTVMRARRRLARVEVALEYLTSDQPSPIRSGSKGLLPVVVAIQQAGAAEALKAEVYRVQIEVLRRQEERSAALQDFRVAVAELARLLRLDPSVPLWPMEDFRVPMEWPGPSFDQPLEELVRLALNNRPELAENQALVQAAVERVRTARFRPLLPNLIVNYSWGDFGGGPDPNPAKIGGFGPSGRILHVGTRADFDVSLMWRLQNLGVGNHLEIRQQESLARQASQRLYQLQDQVITQVLQARESTQRLQERFGTTRSALFDPSGKPNGPVFEAIRLNFGRVREVQTTRPLEVLDSIRSLSDLLETYGQDATDFERARFRLMITMGLPPLEIITRVTNGEAGAAPQPK